MAKPNQLDLDMRQLMGTPAFLRFLLQTYKDAGIGIPANGADATLLAYREARRSLGLEIFRQAARGLTRGTIEQVLVAVLSEATPKENHDAPAQDDLESEDDERR